MPGGGPEDLSVERVADALSAGSVVVVPTDTVYGLAASPLRPDAVARLYAMKGRPATLNLPVIIGDVLQLDELGVAVTPSARRLAERYWPGPLTMVFAFDPTCARPGWLEGRSEVAVRQPAHEYLCAVARRAGPLLVTSANRHGQPTERAAAAAAAGLAEPPDLVVDGGELHTVPSTLVIVSSEPVVVEREGALPPADVYACATGARA